MRRFPSLTIIIATMLLPAIIPGCGKSGDTLTWQRDDGTVITADIDRESDTLYNIRLYVHGEVHSTWTLPYQVYRFCHGDIDGDGRPEIGVGVVKATRYDSVAARRLFLFRITDDLYIRPLWLGSRVSHPLHDFTITDSGYVHTVEHENDGTYLAAEYCHAGFGLRFRRYLIRNTNLSNATDITHSTHHSHHETDNKSYMPDCTGTGSMQRK